MQGSTTKKVTDKGSAKPSELEYSFFTVIILTGVYIAYELLAEPRGGHPFGHILGIVGATMMVMTETLYSIRKRTNWLNRMGPVRNWLSFHIFTGIVGPFLVLMHTGLEFRGLAGVSALLTLIVVSSGFFGRYLYTALPRRLSGVAQSRAELGHEVRSVQQEIDEFQVEKPQLVQQAVASYSQLEPERPAWIALLGRSYFEWQDRRRLRAALRQLVDLEEAQQSELEQLLNRQRQLNRQLELLTAARRGLRVWHIIHIPLGLTLFFSVAIHVLATIYFQAGLFGG